MRKTILLVSCLWISTAVQAMSWQELQSEIDSVESGKAPDREIIMRFSEIVQMLVTYNRVVQETAPGTQLFCPAPGGSMHIDVIVSMVRSEARLGPAAGETLVQDLMLASFRERFPCN